MSSLDDINKIQRPAVVPQKGNGNLIKDYFVIFYGPIPNLI